MTAIASQYDSLNAATAAQIAQLKATIQADNIQITSLKKQLADLMNNSNPNYQCI